MAKDELKAARDKRKADHTIEVVNRALKKIELPEASLLQREAYREGVLALAEKIQAEIKELLK